jgi:hypothetical protein
VRHVARRERSRRDAAGWLRGRLSAHARHAAAVVAMSALPVGAQERLVGTKLAAAGASYESISFGGEGLPQAAFSGLDSVRVQRVRQFTLPLTAAVPLAGGWRLDVTTLYSSGSVTYRDRSANGVSRTAALSGISDLRLRATGRVFRDALIITLGANAPTGRTTLSPAEFSALRVLSSPALGMGSTPVGAGPSGTLGVVAPQQLGSWQMAYGASLEMRGRYQPIAALTAGSASADFRPGGVVRASVTGDRLVGPHRLIVAMAADVFATDRLIGPVAGDASGASRTEATVQLGPVYSVDAQMQLAVPHIREVLVYSAYRWRAPFARDGITVERSSGQYLETGARGARYMGPGRDFVFAGDVRWHSGLGIDQGLPTAGVSSAALTLGVNVRRGLLSGQPYVRVQAGSLSQQSASGRRPAQSFGGTAAGLVFSSRF